MSDCQGVYRSCTLKMKEQHGHSLMSACPSHPQSSGHNERTGRLTMSQLTNAKMQDRLSWYGSSVYLPVWRRSLYSTQRLPVMGLAAKTRWISQGIRHGNMVEGQKLRGRETVLVSQAERCHANANDNQVGSGCQHKDGEPCALKGASTVRGGGHAMPTGPTVPTLLRDVKASGK